VFLTLAVAMRCTDPYHPAQRDAGACHMGDWLGAAIVLCAASNKTKAVNLIIELTC